MPCAGTRDWAREIEVRKGGVLAVENARLREIQGALLASVRDALGALELADADAFDGGALTTRMRSVLADAKRWQEPVEVPSVVTAAPTREEETSE